MQIGVPHRLRSFIPPLSKLTIVTFCILLLRNHYSQLYASIFDSYSAVGIFVASTLLVVYLFEHYTADSMMRFLTKHENLQVPVSTFLGVLPGCGGAIIVVTQYSKGCVTFGSMTATLIATMGDAAILLIQKKPEMALLLFVIVSICAIIMGYTVDFLSKEKFVLPANKTKSILPTSQHKLPHVVSFLWFTCLALSTVMYLKPSLFATKFIESVNCCGMIYCIILWMFKSTNHSCEERGCFACCDVFGKVAIEASFIISWVFIGMAGYQAFMVIMHFDLEAFVVGYIYYVPLAAALLGIIPGCGPQIVLATLYIGGAIPFSAQVTNAISNDGDALMPAIAMQPKKALLATVYSFIPALIVGYGMLIIFRV